MRFLNTIVRVCLLTAIAFSMPVIRAGTDPLPPLSVSLAEGRLSIAGAQAGGTVLIAGYEKSPRNYSIKLHRHRALLTVSGAGTVSFEPQGEARAESVWVAIDVQSGRFGIVASNGDEPRHAPIAESALKKDNVGQLRKYVAELPMAYLIVVRPGEGAWELFTGDGGRNDDDKSVNGKSEASLRDFKPVGSDQEPPPNFRKGDLLLVFSPQELSVSSIRLEK